MLLHKVRKGLCMKLTNKHFVFFRKECEKRIAELGLSSWCVKYAFNKLENDYANISWNYKGRIALITLSNEFESHDTIENQLCTTALHECLELLLSPLIDLAEDRTWCDAEFEKEKHAIIRTLEKLL